MWLNGNYRRIFLDMHINDDRPEYLQNLNPEKLVNPLADAGAQQIVVKCRSHTGLAYFPTEYGRMHRGLKGRDYVGEMIGLCHGRGIAVMAYFSQIFDNLARQEHPHWRIIDRREYEQMQREGDRFVIPSPGRYGLVCPNNPAYREYVKNCLQELTANYEFESIFLDMPFFPEVCYCPSCAAKYFEATGKELPAIIDWDDPACRDWQRLREEWLHEFTALSTAHVKAVRPEVTVEHNMAVVTGSWSNGATDFIADDCDYMGGDLYGGFLEQSFICKYYKNLSRLLPFSFIASRCAPGLNYHTTTKHRDELLLHAVTALVHNGACSICDGMNPDGTLNEAVYKGVIQDVFSTIQPYEHYVNGNLNSNVAIWFSGRSKYNAEDSGKPILNSAFSQAHIENPKAMARILREENIPFDVIPDKCLKGYRGKVLIICDTMHIQDEAMEAIEAFVLSGGHLYVSGHLGHERLYQLLEATPSGLTTHTTTYMSPTEAGKRFFTDFSETSPMYVKGKQLQIRLDGTYECLATLTLPYTMTGTSDFASIHSDPPGIPTEWPSAVMKQVGKGRIFWTAAAIESAQPYMSRQVVGRILRELCGELPFSYHAPSWVEVLSWTKDNSQYFAVINQQEHAPIAPVYEITVELPYRIHEATLLETNEALEFTVENGKSVIFLPKLTVFQFFSVR